MSKSIAVCGVEQHRDTRDLHITDEIVNREIVSNYQNMLGLEAEKLRDMKGMGSKVHNGKNLPNTQKIFYFTNVRVDVVGDIVEVKFSDGHKERFGEAEVVKFYDTLRFSDHGPTTNGITKNPDTDTVHFVDSEGLPVCGDSNVPVEDDPIDFDINADSLSFYRPICGRCKNVYTDGFIQTLIDLRLSPLH